MIQAILGIVLGIFIANVTPVMLNANIAIVLVMTSIDAILGGLKAKLESNFNDKEMISGLSINLVAALTLIYFGQYFNFDLCYLALFALVMRIFKNLSKIHKYLLKK